MSNHPCHSCSKTNTDYVSEQSLMTVKKEDINMKIESQNTYQKNVKYQVAIWK